MPPYARVLLKLSGESLAGGRGLGIDSNALERIAKDIVEASNKGVTFGIVIGGGNFFRGASSEGLSVEQPQADAIGMLATCMNGVVLAAALRQAGRTAQVFSALPIGDMGGSCQPYARGKALQCLQEEEIAIFVGGTGHPYFTTDTAATLRAAEMDCNALFKATKVDGVYAADPKAEAGGGERFDHISYDEALARGLRFMDATALALARDTGMPILLFSIEEGGNLARVSGGEGVFTRIDSGGKHAKSPD
ncbi:MAG: UMP kinase [Hyphomicrobiales bacterium]|nr:UMP kinase [Hyphomicrobiales bacterium]